MLDHHFLVVGHTPVVYKSFTASNNFVSSSACTCVQKVPSLHLFVFFCPGTPSHDETNKEDIVCIVRTINKKTCANDPFKICTTSSELTSDPITTVFTDRGKS